jgi:hypothetical protein
VNAELAELDARFDALLLAVQERQAEVKMRAAYTGRRRVRDVAWLLGHCVELGWCAGRIGSLGGRRIKFAAIDGQLVVESKERAEL